jgi:hypothetical protein
VISFQVILEKKSVVAEILKSKSFFKKYSQLY